MKSRTVSALLAKAKEGPRSLRRLFNSFGKVISVGMVEDPRLGSCSRNRYIVRTGPKLMNDLRCRKFGGAGSKKEEKRREKVNVTFQMPGARRTYSRVYLIYRRSRRGSSGLLYSSPYNFYDVYCGIDVRYIEEA